ncbi:hypothetical protein AcW1_009939 [Taiwanofungus camphoratus]|nr:hypothetical protein AcW1_009939 [Antrodia cinnamomea]
MSNAHESHYLGINWLAAASHSFVSDQQCQKSTENDLSARDKYLWDRSFRGRDRTHQRRRRFSGKIHIRMPPPGAQTLEAYREDKPRPKGRNYVTALSKATQCPTSFPGDTSRNIAAVYRS